MNAEQIIGRLKNFLEEEFPNPGVELEESTDLLNEYFVDSLGIVNTAIFLESEFQIELARADINESNFHSVETLTNFVVGRLEVPAR